MARHPDRLATVVVCLPGLEGLVTSELTALGIRPRPAGTGAVAARMTHRQLYLANATLATATRVLVDAGTVEARSFSLLEQRLTGLDLHPWVVTGRPTRIRVSTHRCRLHHTGAIEERLRTALHLGPAPDDDTAEAALLVVRGQRDVFSIRVDSSGAPLHHRGWRGPAGKAPLRESLAAAALATSGWTPGSALLDPFCGSGTILIEAARAAAGIAPGAGRGFAFADWPSFAPGTWASVAAEVEGRLVEAPPAGPFVGRDRDAGAIAAAAANAEAAGVLDRLDLAVASISELTSPGSAPGWVVTNPPWGGRIGGGGDLRDLYARFGQVVRAELTGWGVAMVVGDDRLAAATGLRGEVRLRSRAGGTPVSVVVVDPT